MKKFISILTCSMIIISSMFISFADKQESNPIFFDFISNATISEIEVVDSSGNIVNNRYSDDIKNDLISENYDKVIESLTKYDLVLLYENKEVDSNKIGIFSVETDVNFDKDYYHLKTDSTGKFKKEWLTNLKGSYRENSDGTFTASGNPRISVTADFGGSFSIKADGYSTGYSYKNDEKELNFYGSYNMDADAVIPIKIAGLEFPIGFTFHWGQINVNHSVK